LGKKIEITSLILVIDQKTSYYGSYYGALNLVGFVKNVAPRNPEIQEVSTKLRLNLCFFFS
jgi:hypothetical protein